MLPYMPGWTVPLLRTWCLVGFFEARRQRQWPLHSLNHVAYPNPVRTSCETVAPTGALNALHQTGILKGPKELRYVVRRDALPFSDVPATHRLLGIVVG